MEALLNKPTILHKVEAEYQAFTDLLAPLDGWQLTTPCVVGEWSIKDLLAHLTIWQKHLLTVLRAARHETTPETPIAQLTCEDIDCLNQAFYAAAKARPLSDVWAVFRATYRQVKQELEALSEETLTDPERYLWLDGMALSQVIATDTYEHYQEHTLLIRAWLMD